MKNERTPHLSDERIDDAASLYARLASADVKHYIQGALAVRDIYEAELARKDAEIEALIGRLKHQVTLCEFRDEQGHLLDMSAAYLGLITYKP